jgi:hypothetical protein
MRFEQWRHFQTGIANDAYPFVRKAIFDDSGHIPRGF